MIQRIRAFSPKHVSHRFSHKAVIFCDGKLAADVHMRLPDEVSIEPEKDLVWRSIIWTTDKSGFIVCRFFTYNSAFHDTVRILRTMLKTGAIFEGMPEGYDRDGSFSIEYYEQSSKHKELKLLTE